MPRGKRGRPRALPSVAPATVPSACPTERHVHPVRTQCTPVGHCPNKDPSLSTNSFHPCAYNCPWKPSSCSLLQPWVSSRSRSSHTTRASLLPEKGIFILQAKKGEQAPLTETTSKTRVSCCQVYGDDPLLSPRTKPDSRAALPQPPGHQHPPTGPELESSPLPVCTLGGGGAGSSTWEALICPGS